MIPSVPERSTRVADGMPSARLRARLLAAVLSVVPVIVAAPAAMARGGAAERPNIIFFIADDLGVGDVRYLRDGYFETPNIDRLAAQSVSFSQAYVTAAVCSPSRAALHTGRYQARFGHDFNPGSAADIVQMALPASERSIAERMKAAGYRTGLIGKWHLENSQRQSSPLVRGFDYYFGFASGGNYILNLRDGDQTIKVEGERDRDVRSQGFSRQGTRVEIDDYKTDVITDEAVRYIEANRSADEPYFLVVAHHAPHVPLEATKKYLDRVVNVADPMHRVYAAMATALDDGLGKVLDAADASGSRRPTMVVFLSDNGCPEYASAACSNAPYSGFKRELREGGLRTPLLIRWPDHKAWAGRKVGQPVSSLDAVASMVVAAGLSSQLGELDGVDLLPTVRSGRTARELMFWRAGTDYAVREGDWKLVVTSRPDGSPATFLFDLKADPKETRDLSAKEPARVRRLTEAFAVWDKGNIPSRMQGRLHDSRIAGQDVKVRY